MDSTHLELNRILETLALYQQGHSELDKQKLEQAFHKKANIVGYTKEELRFANRDEYIKILLGRDPVNKFVEPPYTNLLSLDKTDTTIVVKVESRIAGVRYTSFLSMLKCDERWQIVNGLFHAEDN